MSLRKVALVAAPNTVNEKSILKKYQALLRLLCFAEEN
jgi:hypothetical protein